MTLQADRWKIKPYKKFWDYKVSEKEGQTVYTATMVYPVKEEFMEDFTRLWGKNILNLAIDQPGFVRMQLLTREGEAMALGTWTDKSHAENFMALGPFKNLMAAVKDMLVADPKPTIWNLSSYASR